MTENGRITFVEIALQTYDMPNSKG